MISFQVCALGRHPRAQRAGGVAAQPRRQLKAAACYIPSAHTTAIIIFVAVDAGDRTFSYVTFALILVGAAIEIVSVFFDYKFLDFLPVVSCACYGVAFGMHLYLGLSTLSDRWNGVNFVGGNGDAVITFAILFGIGLVAALAAGFMKRRRPVEEQ